MKPTKKASVFIVISLALCCRPVLGTKRGTLLETLRSNVLSLCYGRFSSETAGTESVLTDREKP